MIIADIILVLLIRNGDIALCRVDQINRRDPQFPWKEKRDLRVKSALLIAYGNARADIPPSSEIGFKFLAFAMHYLCMTIRERNVGLPWDCVRELYVNDSHILSTAGADTTTMMTSWMVYKLIYI